MRTMIPLHLVAPMSQNRKLGGCACTYRPVGLTCPPDCPLMWNEDGEPGPCYAKRGLVAGVAKLAESRADHLGRALGAAFVRHLASGDIMREDRIGRMVVDVEYVRSVYEFHRESPQSQGWIYTHAHRRMRDSLRAECPPNLAMLASCDSLDEAHHAQAKGWRTARVTDDLSTRESGEFVCPYDAAKGRGVKQKVTCVQCRACWERDDNIVFLKF